MLKNLKSYALVVAFAIGVTCAYNNGYNRANNKWEQEVRNEYVKRTEATADTQRAINEVSQKYQDDIAGIEGSTDRVINDLRSDGKRLRVKLRDTQKPGDNSGCFTDGKAELDEKFSKRLIGVTQRGDAWIEALQNTIKEMQKDKEGHR